MPWWASFMAFSNQIFYWLIVGIRIFFSDAAIGH